MFETRTPLLSLHPQGMIVSTPGLAGGAAGRRASVSFAGPDGRRVDAELDGMAELARNGWRPDYIAVRRQADLQRRADAADGAARVAP